MTPPQPQPKQLWTVGHSTRTTEAFIALLEHYGIRAPLRMYAAFPDRDGYLSSCQQALKRRSPSTAFNMNGLRSWGETTRSTGAEHERLAQHLLSWLRRARENR